MHLMSTFLGFFFFFVINGSRTVSSDCPDTHCTETHCKQRNLLNSEIFTYYTVYTQDSMPCNTCTYYLYTVYTVPKEPQYARFRRVFACSTIV